MALKINQLDEQSVTGILDGALCFQVTASEGVVTARISNWTCMISGRAKSSAAEMRRSAYEVLARYREEHKRALRGQAQLLG